MSDVCAEMTKLGQKNGDFKSVLVILAQFKLVLGNFGPF